MKKILALLGVMLLGMTPSYSLYAQADFAAAPTAGCAPLGVAFSDLTPNAVSWSWDFGNGTTSSLQSPGLIYSNAGTYDVQLIVGYADGSQDTVLKSAYINVFDAPIADFVGVPTQLCQGDSVSFLDQSTLGSGTNLTVNWDFGDGTTTSSMNPSHAYTTPGSYNIIYAIIDENGCGDVLIQNNYISVDSLPDAAFSFDIGFSCTAPVTVSFTANDITLGTQHFWDFGDGTTSAQVNPQHTYNSFGVYDVLHTIVSTSGACSDTLLISNAITIGNVSPIITTVPATLCENSPIAFSTNAGASATHNWDFGDGTSASTATPTHTYLSAGTYTLSVSVLDLNGCLSDTTISVSVGQLPTAGFSTIDTLSCSFPYTANFNDLSQNAVAWLWDFGDGNTSTQANPSHTYTSAGTFDVSLTVWNA
ncbi:MAG: PKD domain-containing protein, partial [Bacteroidota bacterium]